MKRLAIVAICAVLAAPTALAADSLVSDTRTSEDFKTAFCAADRSTQHIFIVPMSVFQTGGELSCDDGTSTLRMSEPSEDPGHAVVNIDPPSGVENGFDCDGKADLGMSLVAINCLPANLESADHG
ncbi:MAG: hypothetical protein AAGF94_03635 [Pseudomonadota bacterium]